MSYEKCRIISYHIYLSYMFFFCYFAFPSADNKFLILPSRLTNGLQLQLYILIKTSRSYLSQNHMIIVYKQLLTPGCALPGQLGTDA